MVFALTNYLPIFPLDSMGDYMGRGDNLRLNRGAPFGAIDSQIGPPLVLALAVSNIKAVLGT